MQQVSKYIYIVMMVAIIASCKKSFLEVTPKGKLIAQSVEDYNMLLSNLDLVNLISSNAQVPLGDDVAAIEPYFSGTELKTQRLFRWEDVTYEPTEDAGELITPLKNIYTYNKIINEVPNATDGTEQRKLSIKAEALAGRAWTYFTLINYFGKPYNTATSATDPGFPIVKIADVTQTKFSRATVKEVYDFIVNDLTEAIPHLPVRITSRVRMSRPAAEGLLAKVYVFMGRFDEAVPHLDAAIAGLANAAIPVGLYDYNVTFAPGGEFQPIDLFGVPYPNLNLNQENLYGKQAMNSWAYDNSLVMDKKTAALYDPADLRLNFFSTTAFFGPEFPEGYSRRTSPGTIQFGVIVPELYLLRAECKARANDLPGATADLEAFRSKRLPAGAYRVPTAIASRQLTLLNYVIQERMREFALTGFRWFDMRRLSVDNVIGNTSFTHTLLSSTGVATNTYNLRPERFALRFPLKIIAENPGMENNP